MVERIQEWVASGKEVKIFTARVAFDEDGSTEDLIKAWCKEHLGFDLEVTNKKDYGMIELWDDRAIQVKVNTGERVDGQD